MFKENVEEYLGAIYSILEEGSEITSTKIAEKMNVKPSSVTEMLRKLDAEGYIRWKPYGSIELTEKGFKKASKIKRKHRIVERFLHDLLKIKKNKIHEEACRIEHAISDEAAESLSRLMNHPRTCPDDLKKIVPLKEINKPTTIADLSKGETAVVAYLNGGCGFRERMNSLGIREGRTIQLIAKEPFGGPYVIKTENTTFTIGRGMASKIHVIKK